MHEFLHFNQQRQAFASIRTYLESISEYENYLQAVGGERRATQPSGAKSTPTTPEEVAHRMGEMLSFVHETALDASAGHGTSREEFDQQMASAGARLPAILS